MAGHAAQEPTAWDHEQVPPWRMTAEQLRVLDELRELELLYGPSRPKKKQRPSQKERKRFRKQQELALGDPDDGSDRRPVRESRASGANAGPCLLRPAATSPDAGNMYPDARSIEGGFDGRDEHS
jgi:hypothetical protein